MLNAKDDTIEEGLLPVISRLIVVIVVLVICLIAMSILFYYSSQPNRPKDKISTSDLASTDVKKDGFTYWMAPEVDSIADAKKKRAN